MKFLLAFFGWLAWTLLILRFDKDPMDDADKAFSLRGYALKNWDNWSFTFMAVLILGFTDMEDSIMYWINSFAGTDYVWNKACYTLGGFGFEVIFFAAKKWRKKKQSE